jgi:hypothetical protein
MFARTSAQGFYIHAHALSTDLVTFRQVSVQGKPYGMFVVELDDRWTSGTEWPHINRMENL